MDKETRRHLLQSFISTKGDLGKGLGLYMSREIVRQHGDRFVVGSALGKGTGIRVVLPRRDREHK